MPIGFASFCRVQCTTRGCSSVNPRMELIYEQEINGSFDTTKAKCNWQEWIVLPKGQRGYRPKDGVTDRQGLYEIVPLGEDHDLVIQRCGGSAGRVTTCNRTGQGKYYIRTRYPAVRRAFKNLSTHAAANLTTHQDSLSARMLHELLERSLLSQYIRTIKGEA